MKFDKPLISLVAIVVALLLSACHKDEPDVPGPEPPAKVKRTVLVYMAADNTLGISGFDHDDLAEMERAVKTDGLNDCRVIIYHHARSKAPVLKELTTEGFDTLKVYPYDDVTFSIDASRMEEVIADSRTIAPAHDYGLVLWSHGSGWIEPANSRRVQARSFGDDRGHYMKVTTLASVLEDKGYSWIYFDCCHMAAIEVMYELRHCAPVIVGSVIELPADGMRYDLNMPIFLADEPDMVQAAANTFEYYDAKTGSSRTCAMTVVNTSALDALADATRRIMEQGASSVNRSVAQPFMLQKCTLFDLGQYIDAMNIDPVLKDEWHRALDDVLLYSAHTPYIWSLIALNHCCGLATYILETPADAEYMGYNHYAWWRDVVSHNPLFVDNSATE